MEKAILKTLIYADIFDYPLKAWEVHKWLIGKKATLKQVEKGLNKLTEELRIKNQGGYYFLARKGKKTDPKRSNDSFLSNSHGLVKQRLLRQRQSEKYLGQAKLCAKLFKLIPWIKLVGVSGSLALMNASENDDIDLFVVTQKDRLFLSRLLILFILEMVGKRRKKHEKKDNIAGKICINILLEEDRLDQYKRNIYIAHEVLQMAPLYEKEGIYSKFLTDNKWVFKYLPNWISGNSSDQKYRSKTKSSSGVFSVLEKLVRNLQMKYMGKPKGQETVTDSELYLHPEDYGPKILEEYNKRISKVVR